MSYASFAQYYDSLTHNVEYARRADYLCTLLAHLGHAPGLTLDLACGTGSLTVELAKRGMDIYGIDGSADMLSVARQKAAWTCCFYVKKCKSSISTAQWTR